MKISLSLLVCVTVSSGVAAQSQTSASSTTEKLPVPHLAADYGKLPLSFEANQGQVDSQVRFTSRGNGYSLFLTDKEAVLALSRKSGQQVSESASQPKSGRRIPHPNGRDVGHPNLSSPTVGLETDVVWMQLAGAKTGLKVEGEEKLAGTANYFIGNDPAKWHSNVPTYSKVKYSGVYPGVDLVYYGNQQQLEYDFMVAPGADPKQVKLHFAGAEKLRLTPDGDLEIVAKNGEIAFHKPVVYQLQAGQLRSGQQVSESASQREVVEGKFVLLAGNTVGFKVGSYDKSRELVIDPTLAYSTYLGGSSATYAFGIAADADGNAYMTGYTYTGFPVTNEAFQTVDKGVGNHQYTVFVTKFNPSGSGLIYSTYLGGSGQPYGGDWGTGITVDTFGSAYVIGYTYSTDFPITEGAFQTVNNVSLEGTNAFVTKLDPTGSTLAYSTYLGGMTRYGWGCDRPTGIVVNSSGNAYVTGSTCDMNFPVTSGAFQTVNNSISGGSNGFITEFNSSGSALVYSTYLGGSDNDASYGIAVDGSGSAYVTGYAHSADFPVTAGAFDTSYGPSFITKLNPSGSALIYSTYFSGSTSAIAVDPAGDAYVTGSADGDHPIPTTPGAFQTTGKGTLNAFVSKLNPSGTALVYSTYLGGSGSDSGYGIAVDTAGYTY